MSDKKATLYVIGTELTRGIICDSHIPLLAKDLTELGYSIKRAVIVPDDGTIGEGIKEASLDSDLIVVTGGLGPTSDDMTRNIIASVASVKLERNEEAWKTLCERIGDRANGPNSIQAMIPQGFTVIPNPNGTAPGFRGSFAVNQRNVTIVAMPGPPAEMRPMFFNYVKPYLSNLIGKALPDRDEYTVFVVAEAKLEELCQKCRVEGVDWGTRFQQFCISLYVNGKNPSDRKLFIEKLRKIMGDGLLVEGDNKAACTLLTQYLIDNKLTISCAESCTSGSIAKMLTDQSGSSAYFWGGCSTYDNTAKEKLVGVKRQTLEKYGAVSYETAIEMAEGMRKVSCTSASLSVTGIAGPTGGSDEKPVGTVWFGFSAEGKKSQAVKVLFKSTGREAVRKKACVAAFILAYNYLNGKELIDMVSTWLYI